MAYRAVRADPGESRDTLLRLWTDNLSVQGDPGAKHRWQYLDAPTGPAEAFLLRTDGDVAVGCAGITVRELWHRGRAHRAALLGDLAIDRAHRTVLPALILQRAVKRHVDEAYALSYGFPNAHAVGIHRRIGYHELAAMPRYVRVLRHARFLERRWGHPHASWLGGVVIDGAKLAVRLGRAVRTRKATLGWQDDVDARFDRLWEATRDQYGIVGRRDAAFLRWRFLRKPDERAKVVTLVDRASQQLRAYAIVGGVGDNAQLVDLFGSVEALGDLLTLLAPALTARGFATVGVRFLGDPRIAALLAAQHFSLRDAQRTVIVHEGSAGGIEAAAVRTPSAWYLTDLDEDT